MSARIARASASNSDSTAISAAGAVRVGMRRSGKAAFSVCPISGNHQNRSDAMKRSPAVSGRASAARCIAATSRTSTASSPTFGSAGSLPRSTRAISDTELP